MNPDIFIITSVINTGNKPWSYTHQRSYYTVEKRYEQTLQTIQSIRDLNDGSKVMLVECSDITDEMTTALKGRVDYFIQTYGDDKVRHACLESNKKGFGEIKKLQKACQYIKENNLQFNRLFKISGRYFLNSAFNKQNYASDDAFTFKMFSPTSGSTVLYSVPNTLFDTYTKKIDECSNYYDSNPPTGIETLLPLICTPKREIDTLGVSGYVAVVHGDGEPAFYVA
jgi:hypothetical protein